METGSGSIDITMESIKALQEVTDLLHPTAVPARGAEVVPGAAPGSAPTRETLYQAASRVTRVHNMLEALSLQIANQYRDLGAC